MQATVLLAKAKTTEAKVPPVRAKGKAKAEAREWVRTVRCDKKVGRPPVPRSLLTPTLHPRAEP